MFKSMISWLAARFLKCSKLNLAAIGMWQVGECQEALAEDFIGDRESSPSSPYRDELFEKGGASNPTPTSVLQLEEALSGELTANRERW